MTKKLIYKAAKNPNELMKNKSYIKIGGNTVQDKGLFSLNLQNIK